MTVPAANAFGATMLIVLVGLIGLLNLIKYGKLIRDLMEPITWFALFLGIFFIYNFLFVGYEFSWPCIWVIISGSIIFILGYYSQLSVLLARRFNGLFPYKKIVSPTLGQLLLLVVFVFGFQILFMAWKLSYWNVSLDQYLSSTLIFHAREKMGGYFYMPIQRFISSLFYLLIFLYLSKKKNYRALIIPIGLIVLFTGLNLSASRWSILSSVLLTPFILYQVLLKRKAQVRMCFVLILILVPFLLIVVNEWRHRGTLDIGRLTRAGFVTTGLQSLRGDTIPARNLDKLVRYLSETYDYHYGWYFVTQLLTFMPRFVWRGKPVTSFDFAYTLKVMGINPITSYTTHAFTIFDSYAWLGWGTLLFASLLIGILSRAVYEAMWRGNVFFLLFAIPFIRNYLLFLRGSSVDIIPFYIVDFAVIFVIYYTFKLVGLLKVKTG